MTDIEHGSGEVGGMTARDRAEAWYVTECAIALGLEPPPNRYAGSVPEEVREEFYKRLGQGRIMPVTRRHFEVWAAVAEAMGTEKFAGPLGWSEEEIRRHLLLQ